MLIACRAPSGPRLLPNVERLLDSFFADDRPMSAFAAAPTLFPAVNVLEDAENFFIEAELPGYRRKEIEISALGDELTIRGRPAQTQAQGAFLRRERMAPEFERTIRLPLPFDADNIRAELSAGVLTVTLPKTPAAKPRRIEVRSA